MNRRARRERLQRLKEERRFRQADHALAYGMRSDASDERHARKAAALGAMYGMGKNNYLTQAIKADIASVLAHMRSES